MIYWCSLCNAAPADGILTILRNGETQTEDVKACNGCVERLGKDDWIDGAPMFK